MRIDELRLIAFGPFTGTVLDLSRGQDGFHLVYGANEAGKSSALRALRYALYGIPERSADDFIHPYAKMRIGAVIRSADRQVFEFVRRKGRGSTLRATDSAPALDETDLQHHLGHVHAELFDTMFAIGHDDLVRGGRDIVKGGGDVGRLVFSAASGIVNLREIQNELQEATNRLFRPSGQKQTINEALARLNRHRKDLRDAQLPAREWVEHDEALRTATADKAAVEARLAEQQKGLNRLRRIQEALPLIAGRRDLIHDLADCASAIVLPEDFPEKRRKLLTTRDIAVREKEQAGKTIDAEQRMVSELDIAPRILDNDDLIEALHRELGSQRKASTDRVSLETRRSTLYGEARETLRNLRDDLTIEQAEGLRIKKAEMVRIQELSVQYERLITRIDDMRDIIPELIREIDRFDSDLEGLDRPQPVEPLQEAVAAAAEYAPLEGQNRSERAEIQSTIQTIEGEKHSLGLGETALAELGQLPIPSTETIHVFESRFDEVEKRRAETAADIDKTRRTLSQAARQIEAHSLAQDVPTEVDLQEARKWRDHGWRIISRILEGKSVSDTELENYLKKWPDAEQLADAFEISLRQTDALSDRLRREAGRVATKAQLLAEQAAGNEQLEQLASDLGTIEKKRIRILHEWTTLWTPAGISPRTPREMARWTQAVQTLIEKAKETDSRRIKAAAFQRDIDDHRNKLLQSLGMSETPPKAGSASLNLLIKKARAIIDREAQKGRRREQLERDRSLKTKELSAVQSRLRTHEQDLKQWQARWEQAVSPLGLEATALPVEATAVMEELKRLFDRLKEAQILQKRIDGIDRDDREFQRKVKGVVDVVATDLAGRPADEAALELHYRLKRSRDALSRKETLISQLKGERTRFEKAEADILRIETHLGEMCREAACDNIEQLPEAERRSNRKRRIEADLAAVDDNLRRLSGGASVDAFVMDASTVDPDGLSGEIKRLATAIELLNEEKSKLDQTIGSEQNELSRMDGSARAAELAEKIQILLGGLENHVGRYARLKIAARLLSLAIERYREKSQGPILKRASALFHQITTGSFRGLRAEFDDKGEPEIVGVRQQTGEIVRVEGMSDGTADQLYLALRLAGLELYLEKYEPMPFVVDDILIKFDDDRAAATLRALAELSTRTQVIFFTHHRHLMDLAHRHVDGSRLFEHIIGA